ncbi:hypothetical protein C8R45DRAFT_387641 [Mycena sanguinolenta]|nr:hypothetical protein C8R45DRAFT_387641 [Mycena sanguinolenta]
MAATSFSMGTVLAQQTEKTRGSSPIQIKRLIGESDSRITALQNEIAALESRLAALVELRDRECATCAALRSLIAPIRTLPVELLAEIFELTIDLNQDRVHPLRYALHVRDAFRVSQVCCQWRHIATGTPRLWTRPFMVNFRQKRDLKENEMYADGLQTWLARSAPLPVPINIMGLVKKSYLTESGFRTLRSIASRWRSLRMYRTPCSLVQRLVGHCSLDSLEELVLEHSGSGCDPTTIPSFTNAPRLRKVTFGTTRRPSWIYFLSAKTSPGHLFVLPDGPLFHWRELTPSYFPTCIFSPSPGLGKASMICCSSTAYLLGLWMNFTCASTLRVPVWSGQKRRSQLSRYAPRISRNSTSKEIASRCHRMLS